MLNNELLKTSEEIKIKKDAYNNLVDYTILYRPRILGDETWTRSGSIETIPNDDKKTPYWSKMNNPYNNLPKHPKY